jgi:hypothetical protein
LYWQANQSIPHTAVTFSGDYVEMREDFAPNFGDKITGRSITTPHRLTLPYSPKKFWRKTIWLPSPTHPTETGGDSGE